MNLQFQFHCEDIPGSHPNTARIMLTGSGCKEVTVLGASVGGGNILVSEINGMAVHVTGQSNTLVILHRDKPGTIAAVTNFVAGSGVNIGNFRLSRPQKGGEAVMTIGGGRRCARSLGRKPENTAQYHPGSIDPGCLRGRKEC